MARAKKHVSKFWWTGAVRTAADKYNYKWVEGPLGRIWVSSVYYATNGLSCLVYEGAHYKGSGRNITVDELERDYKIVAE